MRRVLQLDTNSSGTVDEAQFLEVLKVVTGADDEHRSALPDADGDACGWRALRLRYRGIQDSCRAQIDVEISRVEVSLTPEPLAMLLGIFERVVPAAAARTQSTDAQGEAPALGGLGLLQAFRSRAFARTAGPLRPKPFDICVGAGPLDIAVLPTADVVRGENAVVLQVARISFHDKLGDLPEVQATADGTFDSQSQSVLASLSVGFSGAHACSHRITCNRAIDGFRARNIEHTKMALCRAGNMHSGAADGPP